MREWLGRGTSWIARLVGIERAVARDNRLFSRLETVATDTDYSPGWTARTVTVYADRAVVVQLDGQDPVALPARIGLHAVVDFTTLHVTGITAATELRVLMTGRQ